MPRRRMTLPPRLLLCRAALQWRDLNQWRHRLCCAPDTGESVQGDAPLIDISGDGFNNRGRPAASARDDAVRAGIIINGLPILALEPDLERYFAHHVIGGPGAFVIATQSYETFAEAILKKLVREMAANE